MPIYEISGPDGKTYSIEGPEGATREQVIAAIQSRMAQQEPERTVLGQVGETFKAVPRGFANTFLSAGEGLAELADAATNVVGLEGAIDTGEENALVKASRAGRDWINNSALGVDPNYADAWFTKFGEGVGSMAAFFTPAAALRGLGAAGKTVSVLGRPIGGAREVAAAGTLATGAATSEQIQRIEAARAQGTDVSQNQEDLAVGLAAPVGLLELFPVFSILKRVPNNITPADKSRILDLLKRSAIGGIEEAGQEVASGLVQNLIEKGIYNENLPIGESLWDAFTVGGAVGAFADFAVNAVAGRRSFITTEAQREYEAKARERRQASIDKIRAELASEAERRANRQADPAAFNKAAEAAQAGAVNIPAPKVEGAPVTAGQAYASVISRELGEFFPTNTKFEVKEAAPTIISRGTLANGEPIVEQKSNFIVVDSAGRQYGQTLQDREQAAGLAYGLNNEVIDGQIRGQIINSLETSGQSYDQVTTDTLTRYGYQILNPEANMITSAALNEAAGTTADKGYIENYSFQTILDGEEVKEDGKKVGYKVQGPGQKEMVVPGLTLAQQINQKRKEQGLPETQTFTIEEARDALGDKFERLTDINVQAIPDGMTYTATLIDGKPSVVSDVQEVFTSRFASQEDSDAAGKNEDGTPKVKVGQKIDLKSLEDAQAFADRKNREAAKGQGLSVKEINELMKGEKTLTNEVTRLLKAKNVGSEIDTPEIKALFKSIVGKESLADMNFGEQRLLYARLRNLPTFEATTKLPVFEAKPYTRENFLRASKFVQDANALDQSVTDEQIAEAAGFLPGDERLQIKVDAIKQDLQKQGVPTVRPAKPVLALPAPTDTTDTYNFLREEIRKKMKGFGLDDIATRIDQTLLNYGDPVRYMQEVGSETEGYYNPFLREITLAVDRIDPNKTLTPEQRVNALVDVLNHEIVHPARELDLWTGQEWDTLSNAAAKLKRRDDQGNPINETYLQWARRTYADQSPLIQEEEAVADLSRQAKKFGAKAVAGKPKVLAEKLFKFFDRLDNSFRGAGFQNYSDILDRLQSGEIGARTRGEVRTLRATEAELAKQGVLPERFADYQPIIATPVARNQEREQKKVQVQQQIQQKAPAGTDFNPAMLEGAAIRESRKSIENVPANIDVDGRLKPTLDSEGRVIYSGYEGPEVFGIDTRPTQQGLRNFWNWFGNSKTTDKQGRPLVFYHGTAADITAFRPKQAGSVFVTRSPQFAEEFGFLSDNYMVSNFPDFMSDQQVLEVLDETLANPASFSPKYYDQVSAAREQVAADVQAGKAIRAAALKPIKEIAAAGRSSRYLNAIQKRLPSSANMIPVYVKAENPFDYDNKEHINRVLKKVREISPIDLDSGQIEQFKKGDWKTIEGEDGNSPILDAIRELGFDSMYVEEQGEKNLAVFDPGQVKSAIGNNGEFSPLTPSIRESRKEPVYNIVNTRTGEVVGQANTINGARRAVDRRDNQYGASVHTIQVVDEERNREQRAKARERLGLPALMESRVRNPQIDTPEFQRFFRNSKVVDANGQPLVVYHGTRANIENFKASRLGGALGTGIYFTPSPEFAGEYATREGGNIIPAYVSIKKPLIIDGSISIDPMIEALVRLGESKDKASRIVEKAYEKKGYITTEVRSRAQDQGFDGIIQIRNGNIGEIVAFNPNQIKSAIGNVGTFDIYSPRILESRSPNVVSIMSNEELPPRKMAGKTQVAQFLQDRALERLGRVRDLNSEADRDAIADDLVEEALYEMDVQKNALEWYDTTIERTIEMLSLKHPEIKTDPNARTAFLTGLAITSQNLAVPDNLKYAEEVYSYFKRTGRFPEKGYGSKAGSIKKNFQKANELINQLGSMEAFTDFLQTKFRAGDLNGILKGHLGKGAKVGGELVDAPVYGSAVFGPKIGNGFYTNLRGDFSPVTIDMWFMRTIGRLRGKLMDFDEKKFAKQLNRLAKAEGMEGASTDDLVARARQLAKQHESDFKKFRSEYDAGIRKKSEATNAAITIVKSLKATRDAPSTGTERAQLRDVVNRAVSKLKDRTGQDIPPAAFQALIWYPEQDLYKKLGVKLRHVRQDYANSTKQFLRQSGVDERAIKRAEDRVRGRRQRRAERVRPGTTEPVEGAVETPSSEVSGTLPQAETEQIVRESRARPKEQLDRAVKKAEENIAKAPTGAIPLYNLNATPEALYVAQNPDAGDKLDANDFIRYSRQNQPQYSPGVDQILDKLAVDPPNQTPGQTVIQSMQMPTYRNLINRFRKEFINNYAQLEYYTQRHPSLLQNTADVSSLVAAELSDRDKAFVAAAINYGVPVYRNGMVKIEEFIHNGRQYKGLIDVMAPIYSNQYGNLERLAQSYAIALRGRRLTAEGKLAPGDPADLPRLEAEVARFVNPNTGEPIIKEWYDAWQAYNGYIIQFLRDTGMIDDAGAQLWLQQSDYIPFYRETAAGTIAHPKIFGGLTSTTHLKAVGKSSEAVNMPLLDSVLTNLNAAISMGMRNVAQQRIIRDMITIGMGRMARPGEALEGLLTVTFKVQGKKYTAILEDPLIFESMQAMPEMGPAGILESIFRVPATVLRELITREPGYMVANMLRDTASAAMITGANIIPVVDTVRNFADGFEKMQRIGVAGGYDFARDPQNMAAYLAEEAKKRGHQIPVELGRLDKITQSKYMFPFKWAWDALGQVTDKAEASTRSAVYEDTLKRTGNEAEAQYQALSVINYGRRGRNPAFRALTAAVPFLNARIQGLDKLYQAGTGQVGAFKDRRKNFARFVMRAGLMVGLTGLYYSLVSDDDEYKNANPETVDNYYILPTPMDFAIKIPIPFEVGLLFKTIPERILRRYHDVDTERDTAQSLLRAATSTLAINPIPQAVLPFAEVMMNYDTFTGRSIVPPYMDERMAAEYQTRFGTNELARVIGEATGYSPIKIDHLLNGYFGTLGTYTLDAIDHVMRDADRMYPSRDPYEYPFVRRFFADANQPGLQSQYYDLYKEVGKVTNTIRQLQEDGRVDELNAYIMENQNILGVKTSVDYLAKTMKQYRDQKDAILKSTLDPDVKKELIDQMDADINRALQVIPILKQAAFNEERQTRQ